MTTPLSSIAEAIFGDRAQTSHPGRFSTGGLRVSTQLSQLLDEMGVSAELRRSFEALHQDEPTVQESDSGPPEGSESGPLLGRYVDLGTLGRGGMAVVQRVEDLELSRRLAMKIIDSAILHQDSALSRFVAEAQTLSQLQHPNIVPVHELGQLEDGRFYFTMKEVQGQPLSEVIQSVHDASSSQRWESSDDGFSLHRLMNIFTRICAAVAFAHSRGVIHRDLKPENVLIGEFDQVLVVDWGIAKIMGQASSDDTDAVRITGQSPHQTQMGAIAGTPAYMAPEQARGQIDQIDQRTDIYALGALLYEMLSGRCPYSGDSHQQVLSRVLGGPPPSVRKSILSTIRVTETIELDFFSDLDETPDSEPAIDSLEDAILPIPDELVSACEKAMHRLRERRHASVDILQREVQDWIDGTLQRDRALKVVEEALGTDGDRQRLLEEAEGLAAQAIEQSASLPPWAPQEARMPAWKLEDRAAQLQDSAALMLARREQLLQASLTHKADLVEAHEQLVQHYLELHRVAESSADRESAAQITLRIQSHLEALSPDHPLRKEAEAYLSGQGAISLVTNPPAAKVFLAPYETRQRRLVPGEERLLGVTPLAQEPLDMGRYQLRIVAEGCHEVIYPVDIGRQHHWDGADPSGVVKPVVLPRLGSLGRDDCFIPPGLFRCGGDPGVPLQLPSGRIWVDGFVLRRYPVTNQEIIEWLNDLSARGLDEALEFAIPRPRSAQGDLGHSCFARRSDGTFELVADEYGALPESDYPAVMISWDQALAYTRWLSEQTGQDWRLPDELEWEKAARGVDGRSYPWGEGFSAAWCCMEDSKDSKGMEGIHSRPEDCSPYGVMDTAGHVFDWTSSIYSPAPELPADQMCRIERHEESGAHAFTSRGGSWHSLVMFSHCAMRLGFPGMTQWPMMGFRVARSLNVET